MPIDTSPHDWRDEIESSFGRGVRESRHELRTVCNIPVRFWVEGDPLERAAVVRNLSEIGAFLETEPPAVGARLRMKLVQNDREELREGEVVWLEAPGPSARCRTLHGVGVRFLPS